MLENVKEMIADILTCDENEMSLETTLREDLGADSLSAVEICMALEEKFGIAIPDENIENLKTIGDIVDYLEEHQA